MNVAVFTPTKRMGGIDVLEASLNRQTCKEFDFFVIDECERDWHWERLGKDIGLKVTTIKPPPISGARNLATAYNIMVEYAIDGNYDLLISLQDYLWLPPTGVERFIGVYGANGDRQLYTGLTSIADEPKPSQVYDLDDPYSIFKYPYYEEPLLMQWRDVRETEIYYDWFTEKGAKIITVSDPMSWEANWAAVPVLLFKEGLRWDEEYDKGVAYENSQFALDAIREHSCTIIIDSLNHAISLPHRDYFDEGEIGSEANIRNKDRFHANLDVVIREQEERGIPTWEV